MRGFQVTILNLGLKVHHLLYHNGRTEAWVQKKFLGELNMPLPADKEVSFRESVNLSCDLAMATLDIPEGMAKYIRNVNNVYQVRFPVKIKGEIETFIGWRAVHSDHK